MLTKKISIACVVALLTAGVAHAQPKSATPGAEPKAAPVTTPATPTAKTTQAAQPASSTAPAGTKVNLNTATADQLDALPEVGKARTKEIMTERAKGNFKDWADFDARTAHTSVNKGVKAKIKDLVTF